MSMVIEQGSRAEINGSPNQSLQRYNADSWQQSMQRRDACSLMGYSGVKTL